MENTSKNAFIRPDLTTKLNLRKNEKQRTLEVIKFLSCKNTGLFSSITDNTLLVPFTTP